MAALKNHPGFWLRDDAAAQFNKAEAENGKYIVNSAGRYEWEQQELINRWNTGGVYNRPPYLYRPAMPATASNHVADGGKAVDLGDWRRFAQHCKRYGFVHSFPDTDPVHFDFVGLGGTGGVAFSQTVKDQQTWLISRGYDLGAAGADGIAGPKYTAAVQSYQTFLKAYGYTGDIDGKWGAGTQTAHNKYYTEVQNGNAVLKARQVWLISRGYDVGSTGADGIWGPKTESAIKSYQTFLKKFGYTGAIDGQWGAGTETAHKKYVASLTATTPTAPKFPLAAGQYFGPEAGGANSISGYHSHNADLKVWQKRMKDRGWPITVDGFYGPKGATTPQGNTAEVAVGFQKEKGLKADGLIGEVTWKAAWTAPVTPTPPTPEPPNPTEPSTPTMPADELAATPNLRTPVATDFPSWIRFDTNADPEGQRPDLNKWSAEYYGVPYNPVESHLHWWGAPGQAGTHDGNVAHIKATKDLSVNFVVSEKRITLMVPINKIGLTTGKRNPYAWKSENDPTLSDWQYKTMGYLHYIVEKLNPSLLNEPLRHHKEFYSTSCSEIDKAKVRRYAEDFRTGKLDPKTGLAPVTPPPVVDPDPEQPTDPEIPDDMVLVSKSFLNGLATEFRALADELDNLAK